MKRLAVLVSALFVLAFATDAEAGPKIVTPYLLPPSDGHLRCGVTNVSDKKEVQVELTIYEFNGGVAAGGGPHPLTLAPNTSTSRIVGDDNARVCVVEVVKGGKKNVRVSAAAEDADLKPLAAVNGH